MSNDVKLEPCPFCGGEAELEDLGGRDEYFVYCTNPRCGVQQIAKYLPDDAIAAWNARHQPQREAVLEALDWLRAQRSVHAGGVSVPRSALIAIADLIQRRGALTTPAPAVSNEQLDTWRRYAIAHCLLHPEVEKAVTTPAPAVKPHCSTCGRDVTEVLCKTCGKWWAENLSAPAVSTDEIVAVLEGIKARGLPDRYKSDVELNDRLAAILSLLRGERSAPTDQALFDDICAKMAEVVAPLPGAHHQSAIAELCEGLAAVLDTSGARGTYHSLRYSEAVERAEALLSKHSPDAPGDAGTRAIEPSDGDKR